jgi:hypothetical protein
MNLEQLNEQLAQVRAQIAEHDRLARALERAETALEGEHKNLKTLENSFRKENADVQRLESSSLVGLFLAVMGRKETRLEEERHELLGAKLKYDNCLKRVETLERDVRDLRERLSGGEGLKDTYQVLLDEKEHLLRQETGEAARLLDVLAARLSNERVAQRELDEAARAGKEARDGLQQVVEALDSAAGWGTWDLLGGGLLASAMKHSRLDEAHNAVQEAQKLLQRFDRELADVSGQVGIDIESGGLTAFADIFIDNLLVDLLVQSRITESLEASQSMLARVNELLARLSEQQNAARSRIEEIGMQRRRIIEQSTG